MASSVYIRFDPEKIMAVSASLERQHKRFVLCAADIMKKAESLTAHWQSDSAALYLDKARELNSQSADMAQIMLEFSRDLADVSGIYKTGEVEAKQKAESLPVSNVFIV